MEDSYTVHRRRKAAARNREKTPESGRIRDDDVAAADEESETRARMEKLVRETERLEELGETEKKRSMMKNSGNDDSSNVAEKSQRVLKRATSPEIRPKNDDVRTKNDEEIFTNADDRTLFGNEKSREEIKKTNVFTDGTESKERSKDHAGVAPRKSKDSDANVNRVVEHRSEVDTNFGVDVVEKFGRSTKNISSPYATGIEKNFTSGQCIEDVAVGEDVRPTKTRSRAGNNDDEKKKRDAIVGEDENRHEAGTRVSDARPVRLIGKNESVGQRDVDRDEKDRETRSRRIDNMSGDKKNSSSSRSKPRSSESESAMATIKRSDNERNVEKIGCTTDSSETEEIGKKPLRRKKMAEDAKTTNTDVRKTRARSRGNKDADADFDETARKRRIDGRSTSRRRPSSDTDEEFAGLRQRTASPSRSVLDKREIPRVPSRHGEKFRDLEKRSIGRSRPPSDTDEDIRSVRKSSKFPVDRSSDRSSSIGRSTSEMKKQIIPLSDDSLIEDFERAQMEYLRKERGILDRDQFDDYVDPKMVAALRRRKYSVVETESGSPDIARKIEKSVKRSWFGWLFFFGNKVEKQKTNENDDPTKTEITDEITIKSKTIVEKTKKVVKDEISKSNRVTMFEFFRTLANFFIEFRAFVEQNPREMRKIRIMRNRCAAELLLAIIYFGLGAFVFRFTEGAFETFYKCGVKRVKRDFLDSLWNFSHNMREDDWKSMARRKLMEFEEQLHTAHEAGVHSYSGQKSWSFLNAVVYCLTVITTIGYGHISPTTTTGRAITIVYAIFGIPMFLIILADFGKLFTRGIKFLWAFVRRVYYTGSCRRVRRTGPVQEVMKGVQLVYDLATFRRPSQMNPEEIEELQRQQQQAQTVLNLDGNATPTVHPPDTPGTPAMSTFAIDDEFNLPISVAIVILLAYIFVGATVYNIWEEWGFFESFYFVFISMSTIGFGDYVPKHPIYMMLSIVYLVFGLALTSMCINVVQEMLSDSFKQASQKISATIGFEVTEDEETGEQAMQPPVEMADVHATIKDSPSNEHVAPKAKQEDVDV